jgi:flagellar basal-body rod protein FlgC
MFRTLGIAASGLTAQRVRLETVAQNLANAETTSGPDGRPYQRRVVRMEAAGGAGGGLDPYTATAPGQLPFTQAPFGTPAFRVPALGTPAAGLAPNDGDGAGGVRVAGVEIDRSEGPLVYDPGHPDANGDGYVRYPNVRVTDEMIEMLDARRIYEANATVFQSAKAMLKRATEI